MAAPGQPPQGRITLQNPLQDLDNAVNNANQEYRRFLALALPTDPIEADMESRPAIGCEQQMAAFNQSAITTTRSMDSYEQRLRALAAKELIQSNLKPDTEIANQVKAAFAGMLKQIPSLLDTLNEAGADFEQHSKETLKAALDQVNDCVGALKDQKAVEDDLNTQTEIVKQLQEDLETAQGEARQTRADCENEKLALNEQIETLNGKVKTEMVARKTAQNAAARAPTRSSPNPHERLSGSPVADLWNPMRTDYIDSMTSFAKDLYAERGDRFAPSDLQELITAKEAEDRSNRKSNDMIENEVRQKILHYGKQVSRRLHPYLYKGDESKTELRRWLDRCGSLMESLEWRIKDCEKEKDQAKKTIKDQNGKLEEARKEVANCQVERDRYQVDLDQALSRQHALAETIETVFKRFKKDSTDWLRLAEEIGRGQGYPTHQGPTYKKVHDIDTEMANLLAAADELDKTGIDKVFQLEGQIQRALRESGEEAVKRLQKQVKDCTGSKALLGAQLDKS